MKLIIETLIKTEIASARKKFPNNEDNLAALTEEVGELAQALLEHKYGNAPAANVLKEAIQVAAMAIRIAEEGDASFPYQFENIHPKCKCPTDCNCQQPPRLLSNECPVHNINPYPAADCPIHGE